MSTHARTKWKPFVRKKPETTSGPKRNVEPQKKQTGALGKHKKRGGRPGGGKKSVEKQAPTFTVINWTGVGIRNFQQTGGGKGKKNLGP